MNPNLALLEPYPFTKLRDLFSDLSPPTDKSPIALSIGEPQHDAPEFVRNTLSNNLSLLSKYPSTLGDINLREAIASWLENRFQLGRVDPDTQVLPVNGTREALFAFAQAVVSPGALVMSPNPFYQIYEGAALLAGASPHFINCTVESGFLPDFSQVTPEQWQRCELLYLCNPGNPTGAVMSIDQLKSIVELARAHDFVIASDECYSEIYLDENTPPPGLLQACAELGDTTFRNCVVFHSLSKRSNLPGLRSGFVAGDSDILQSFLKYRTYHGCAMPPHHQAASVEAWRDEDHVAANRQRYREKFAAVLEILDGHLAASAPQGGFYLWPATPVSDTEFARTLYREEHVTVLPGRFLARESQGSNPGENRVRMALVASTEQCVEAARRMVDVISRL